MVRWFQILLTSLLLIKNAQTNPGLDLNYSMKDLEILERQENYEEFFLHAKDIRPSERGPIWKAMVQNMAEGMAFSKMSKRDFKQNTLAQIENLSDWIEIKESEIFAVKRSEYLINYFQECVKEKYPYCQNELEKAWRKSDLVIPSYVELGLAFAELLQKIALNNNPDGEEVIKLESSAIKKAPVTKGNLTAHSYEFFKAAFSDRFGAIYCLRENVKNAAFYHLMGLGLKYLETPEARIKLTGTVSDHCLSAMNDYLHHQLSSSNRQVRETAYLVLELKHLTREREQDAYLISYLLDGPEVGDTFNQAWARLTKLGEKFERRQEVLKTLKEQDFLPDNLLAHFDLKKIKIILDRFKTYFPEYFDFYARSCLNYFSGIGEFENGNPTLNCEALIKLSEHSAYIDPLILQKLKNLDRFKIKK